jgi:TetR/AcrR family transcriptional regulator, cholesterol catabolism regulator
MFADASVATEIHSVGMQLSTMLTRAMDTERTEPTEDDIAIARVIGDVWLSSLVAWVTGRATATETAEHMERAVQMVLRD